MLALMQRAIALALIALTGCRASASAKPDGGAKLEDGATPDARRIEYSGPSDGGKVEAGLSTFMFAPASIPQSGPELSDPMRGQYLWLGVPAYPAGWPDVDAYSRWNWAQL